MRRIALVSLFLLVTMYAQGQNAPAPPFAGFYAAPGIAGAAPLLSTPAGDTRSAFIVQDFNLDSHPDLLTVGTFGDIALALNDGSGHFGTPVISTPSPLVSTYDAIAIDLNGDGYPDLIMLQVQNIGIPTQYAVSLAVYINQKNGTFAPGSTLALPNTQAFSSPNVTPAFQNTAIGAGVTGASQFPDIVAEYVVPASFGGPPTTTLYRAVFLNDGRGGFSSAASNLASVPVQANFNLSPKRLLLADVDNDGKPDLITGSAANGYNVDVARGNGNGTFATPLANSVATLPYSALRFAPFEWITLAHVSGSANAPNLLIGAGLNVYLAASNGDGTYKPPAVAAIYGNTIASVQLADATGDGVADLLVSGVGNLGVFPGRIDGTFGPLVSSVVDGGGYLNSPAVGFTDVDGDGKLDFLAANRYSADVTFGKGLGDGNFIAVPILGNPTGTSDLAIVPGSFFVAATADMNGDGKADLVGLNLATGAVVIALTGTSGTFDYKVALSSPSPTTLQPVTGDFNGDGRQDLVLTNYRLSDFATTAIGVALSNGDGSVQAPLTFPIPFSHDGGGFAFAVGDVNGDGKQDLVVVYAGDISGALTRTPGGYLVALGKGDGTFQVGSFVPFGTYPAYVLLDRFHGSKAPLDLVIGDTASGPAGPSGPQVSLLRGNGDGTFGAATTLQSGFYPGGLLSADFNRDGNPDLAISVSGGFYPLDGTSAGLYVLSGHGDGTFAAPLVLGKGQSGGSAVAADVNGDGILDLITDGTGLFVSPASDSGLAVFIGNGDGTFTASTTYPLSTGGQLFAGNFLGDNTQSVIANIVGAGLFQNVGGTSVALTATGLNAGQPATLTAQVTPTLMGRPVPTGTGIFYDGATALGTATLANGTASIQTTQLAAGNHTVAFAYNGDGSFQPNRAASSVTVAAPAPPDYTFAPNQTTLAVTRGQSASVQLTITPNANFSAPVSFSCSGLPAETTCSFNPASVTPSAGQPAVTTMTIATKAPVAAALRIPGLPGVQPFAALALLLFPLCGAARRQLRGWGVAALVIGVFFLTGCGSSSSSAASTDSGSPAGTYSVTVTATSSSASGSVVHAVAINLVIN